MRELNIEQPVQKPKKKFPDLNIFRKFWKLKPIYKIIVIVFVVTLAAVGYYGYAFLKVFNTHVKIDTSYVLVSANYVRPTSVSYSIPEPPQVKDRENPINGNLITKSQLDEMQKRKAIALTMNNHSDARPQHALSKADIVMEVLSEGGITRYVPIFYENVDLDKIGPIRSVRLYMIEYVQGFDDPVLLHEGQAGYDNASFEIYNAKADARGYINKNNIKSIQSAASRYRDLEKAKKSGSVHALYTNGDLLKKEIERYTATYKWKTTSSIEPLKFKGDAKLEERGDFNAVDITFLGLSSTAYKASFTYNKQSNTYLRSIAGKPDIDALTNQQIAPKNVIIEWHNYANANDGHSRIVIDMVGQGTAIILRDGQKIEGTWKKDSATARTHYFDAEGNEVELNRGQIWLSIAVKMGSTEHSKVEIR